MAKTRRGTHWALAGFCLAALSAPPGAALSAAEAQRAPSVKAEAIEQSVGGNVQGDASALVDLGGAIYSPFSPAVGHVAAAQPAVRATPMLQKADEGTFGLVATTVTAFIAAGVLFAFVRVLMAS